MIICLDKWIEAAASQLSINLVFQSLKATDLYGKIGSVHINTIVSVARLESSL